MNFLRWAIRPALALVVLAIGAAAVVGRSHPLPPASAPLASGPPFVAPADGLAEGSELMTTGTNLDGRLRVLEQRLLRQHLEIQSLRSKVLELEGGARDGMREE
jgi:hypothetical protein